MSDHAPRTVRAVALICSRPAAPRTAEIVGVAVDVSAIALPAPFSLPSLSATTVAAPGASRSARGPNPGTAATVECAWRTWSRRVMASRREPVRESASRVVPGRITADIEPTTAATRFLRPNIPCTARWAAAAQSSSGAANVTYTNLVKAFTAVRNRPPRHRRHPWLPPRHARHRCSGVLPSNADPAGRRPLHHCLGGTAHSAVEKAAVETGARYIDLWPSSADRDACQPTSQRWIEPVNGPINADPVHPNTAGEAAMAAQMLYQLGIDDHDHNSGKAGDDADGQHRAVEIEDLPGRLHRCRVGPNAPASESLITRGFVRAAS